MCSYLPRIRATWTSEQNILPCRRRHICPEVRRTSQKPHTIIILHNAKLPFVEREKRQVPIFLRHIPSWKKLILQLTKDILMGLAHLRPSLIFQELNVHLDSFQMLQLRDHNFQEWIAVDSFPFSLNCPSSFTWLAGHKHVCDVHCSRFLLALL